MKRLHLAIHPSHAQKQRARYHAMERELRRHQSELLSLVESQTAYLIRVDLSGRYTYINHRFEAQFHFLNPTMLGTNSMDSIIPDDHAAAIRAVESCLAHPGKPVQVTLRKPAPDGGHLWTEWEFVSVRGSTGETEIQCVGFDVTARKHAEEVLRQREILETSVQKEQELQAIKNRMMRHVAHELRTPLAIIQSSVDMLSHYADRMTEHKRQEKLAAIHEEVNRLTELVSDVARLLNDAFETPTLRGQTIAFPLFLARIVERMRLLDRVEHHLYLAADGKWEVMGDPELLETMFVNLISNAIKYSPPLSDIHLSVSFDSADLVLTIQDHGIGIPAADLQHIFEPFYRGANTRDVTGVGLGLSIVQHAVQMHRGSIEIDSTVGVGTTFTIRLPAARLIG